MSGCRWCRLQVQDRLAWPLSQFSSLGSGWSGWMVKDVVMAPIMCSSLFFCLKMCSPFSTDKCMSVFQWK